MSADIFEKIQANRGPLESTLKNPMVILHFQNLRVKLAHTWFLEVEKCSIGH